MIQDKNNSKCLIFINTLSLVMTCGMKKTEVLLKREQLQKKIKKNYFLVEKNN